MADTPEPHRDVGGYLVEEFSAQERALLARHVTDVDGPVFALRDLPQVTCAALFARYSRSPKSLRRLLVEEFAGDLDTASTGSSLGVVRAADLFTRVLAEYGDDSVSQLAGVHIACEQVSQPLAKAIEWGRLASYLEQSTRYIAYTDRRSGRHRYHVDPAVAAGDLDGAYRAAMDGLFETYAATIDPVRAHLDRTLSEEADPRARARAIRALALDVCRALLPAATESNVGVFGSPQALEQLVMRLRADPLPEAADFAERIAGQLQLLIPEFLTRLDRADRGGAWVGHIRDTAAGLRAEVEELRRTGALARPPTLLAGGGSVSLTRFDPDGEDRILAAALFPYTDTGEPALLAAVRSLSAERREQLAATVVGLRGNRRHKPGRGFEHSEYTFEIVSDYGAFRDLQRHRMLTIQWQRLTPALGAAVPEEVDAAGAGKSWRAAVEGAEALHEAMLARYPEQAQYCVTLGHRLRYQVRLNARELMHLVELRSSPQGHPSYRRIAIEMHRQVRDVAGHHLVAQSMRFVGSDDVHLPRYAAEARTVSTG